MRAGTNRSSEVRTMTLHDSPSRLVSVPRFGADLVFVACLAGAQASAADVETLLPMRAQTDSHQPLPIQAALDLLRWSPDRVPRIEVLEMRPPQVSPLAEGWTIYNSDGRAESTIYVAGWSALYRTVLANGLDVHFSV